MKTFRDIVVGLPKFGRMFTPIGDIPTLQVNYNAGGGGYQTSLVFSLNAGVHITIYETSWDDVYQVRDKDAIPGIPPEMVAIGPYCLHLTAVDSGERWFFQRLEGTWQLVTDYGDTKERAQRTFEVMIAILGPFLE
jgi:hypothetical protein